MSDFRLVERGDMGRVAYARIAPNEDLVQSIEKLCVAQGFRNAFVRGALGSLVDACLEDAAGTPRVIRGPAIEIVSLAGEVRTQPDGSTRAALSGVVAACGLAQGMDFPGTVAPFILRGVTLAGVDSVMAPYARRAKAWDRLAREMPHDLLARNTETIGLADAPAVAARLLAGEVRGRVVVDVNA